MAAVNEVYFSLVAIRGGAVWVVHFFLRFRGSKDV